MAVTSIDRTKLISVSELPRVIESAVKTAQTRLGTRLPRGPIIRKWEINGRVLADMTLAGSFTKEVTAAATKAGANVSPAILIIDNEIYAGFIEKSRIPVERSF